MALNSSTSFPPVGPGPYSINRDWCIGDSLNYINQNSSIFDARTLELSTLFLAVSTFGTSLSAKDSSTIDLDFKTTLNILSADIVNNSINAIKLGGDITQSGKALLTAASFSGLSPNQALVWDGTNWANQTIVLGGGGTLPTTDTDFGDILYDFNPSTNTAQWLLKGSDINSSYATFEAVTTAKIRNNAVTPAKLSLGAPSWQQVGSVNFVGINNTSPNSNLTIGSNIISTGTSKLLTVNSGTFTNTAVGTVSALANFGVETAVDSYASLGVKVRRNASAPNNYTSTAFGLTLDYGTGTANIAQLWLAGTGNIGIGTSVPNHPFTVIGSISATDIIYTSSSNSANWTNVFTNVQSNSAQWASNIDTGVRGLTGNWQSTYSTFTNNSANYILQNGNSFGQALTIGTNDSNNLSFETAGTPRITILSTGLVTFVGSISSNNTTTSFNQGSATGSRSFAVNNGRAYGISSHAEGLNTTASGNYSHAEGATTRATADGAHAEGINTVASGSYSHAEGGSTTASGDQSHAEGSGTTASNTASHAEGVNTRASGINSHAEGSNTEAKGLNSHAAGTRATAAQDYTYAWSDGNLGTATTNISTTKTGQYMISASQGVFIPGEIQAGRYTNSQRNILVSTSFGASADSFYLVNTISSVVSATLPSTPLTGDSIKFSDPFSTWSTNLFVVNRNGNNIERLAENLFCDVAGSQFTLTFVGSSVGWRIFQ